MKRLALIFFGLLSVVRAQVDESHVDFLGAIVRGDQSTKKIALVFTGHEFGDGLSSVIHTLKTEKLHASFFLTGSFYRNTAFKAHIMELRELGNYLGSHSDSHLLYCDWTNRDSLLVTRQEFESDLNDSYDAMAAFGIDKKQARYFLPPYEWYNDIIAAWTRNMGLQLVNFTPGTRSTADYTYPEMGKRYVDNQAVMKSILAYEQKDENGLNGFILLSHIGTDPRRQEKFYQELPRLVRVLKSKGYQFVRIDELLEPNATH
ncbi:polysaccharide deacetylase family protein [Parapedobacter sp. 10938]|uniref:polysaccharide deacetylase family protein n=1 Tax=Parapedobacter flavus TaxID=3110225 RepID=UPI002DBFAE81|nr:polysaccharide deacetylase family protein [Parapedobacter sp. 10938]MEC3881499.1 polysaccharide deacetylase family protein [Parapedobacter sp. 10938]